MCIRDRWIRVKRVAEATAVRVRAPSTNRSELCLLHRRAAQLARGLVRHTQSHGRPSARRAEVTRRTGALAVKVGMVGMMHWRRARFKGIPQEHGSPWLGIGHGWQ